MSFLPNITLVLDVWELLSHEGTDGGASIRWEYSDVDPNRL